MCHLPREERPTSLPGNLKDCTESWLSTIMGRIFAQLIVQTQMRDVGAAENPGRSVSPDSYSETDKARVGLQVYGESATSDQSAGDDVRAGQLCKRLPRGTRGHSPYGWGCVTSCDVMTLMEHCVGQILNV